MPILPKKIVTLDSKHNEFMEEFQRNKTEVFPYIKNKINDYEKKKNANINNSLIVKECDDHINKLNEIINSLKKKEIDYYLNNGNIIYNFYKQKQNIDKNKTFLVTKKTNDLQSNINKYLLNTDNKQLNMDNFVYSKFECNNCNHGELIQIEEDGNFVCNNCGFTETSLVTNDKTYKEPPKEISYYAYQKINHFKEIIAQFQGKETIKIDENIVTIIKNQVKKERISLENLDNYELMKNILRKLKLSQYYEHIFFILSLFGIKPPYFSHIEEEKLINAFIDIQPYFHKHCPIERSNFLNYYNVLYHLCLHIGVVKYLYKIPKLKDHTKLLQHDEIMKNIFNDLGWKFTPTI